MSNTFDNQPEGAIDVSFNVDENFETDEILWADKKIKRLII